MQSLTRRRVLQFGTGAIGVVLVACGGEAATAVPPPTITPAPPPTTTLVPPTVTAVPPTPTPLPTATVVPPTPTLLPTATASVQVNATATTLSATSAAFTGSATTAAAASSVANGTVVSAASSTIYPTTTPMVQAVVDKARTRFDALTAVHFILSIEGDIFLDTTRTIKLRAGEGDALRPDRVALTAKVSVGSINAQLKFIQIGSMGYLTDVLTGKWGPAPQGIEFDPRIIFDQQTGVTGVVKKVNSWVLVDTTKVNNTDTQHVRGFVPGAAVNDLVQSSLRGDFVDVDLYIEPKSSDVLRFVLSEQAVAVPVGTAVSKWTLELSKQNQNIKIDAPI